MVSKRRSTKIHGNSFYRLYTRDISRIPLLSVEEERELGRRAKLGDVVAIQKLVESNLRFVIKVAKKYAYSPEHLMELINTGNVGLMEAARRFDPEMDVRFTTYAVWWIRQAIYEYFAHMTQPFRIPPRIGAILLKMARVEKGTLGQVKNISTREELAKEIGVTVKQVEMAMQARGSTISLDQPLDEESGLALREILRDHSAQTPEDSAISKNVRHCIEKWLTRLSPAEQKVIRLRFGLNDKSPLTLNQIGIRMNRSRERIRQIESNALKQLKMFVCQNHQLEEFLSKSA